MSYTDDVWNVLHMLSLTVIPDSKKNETHAQERLELFSSFVTELHTVYSSDPLPTVPPITSCTTQIHVFEWMYNVRKNITKLIPSLKELSIYYQASNKLEPPSALITKDVWGAYIWRFIHTFTLHTTRLGLDKMSSLFSKLFTLLPCSICRDHAAEYLRSNPIPVQSNRDAFKWSVDFHNQVITRTNDTYGYRKRTFTIDEALVLYS